MAAGGERETERRAQAIDIAARALRYRDLSKAELGRRLESRGVTGEDRDGALAALERTGLVDDSRAARARAEALASRAYGDAAIRADLKRRGYASAAVEAALESLPPEPARAQGVLARRGATVATARRLAAKGFAPEVVEELLAAAVAEDAGGEIR